jgi:hypothetical protein
MRRRILLVTLAMVALSGQACSGYVELDVTFFTEMDLEKEVPSDAAVDIDVEGGAYEFLHRVDVDLTEDSDDLSGQVSQVVLKEVSWRVPENTMTGDLHGITLLVGPLASLTADDDSVVTLGTIPLVPAGTLIETTDLDTLPEGEAALKEHLMGMQFTLFVKGYAEIEDPEALPIGKSLIEVDARGEIHR